MVFLAFKGAQLRSTCSTRERPPAGCKTFARLDFRRVPLPAARITMAKSLLGFMRCGHSAGGSKNSQPAVQNGCGGVSKKRVSYRDGKEIQSAATAGLT